MTSPCTQWLWPQRQGSACSPFPLSHLRANLSVSPADPASRIHPKSDYSPRQPPLIQASVTSHHLDSTSSVHPFYKVHSLNGLSYFCSCPPTVKKKIQICTPQYILFIYLNDVHVSLQQCMKCIANHVLKTDFKGCDEDQKDLKFAFY